MTRVTPLTLTRPSLERALRALISPRDWVLEEDENSSVSGSISSIEAVLFSISALLVEFDVVVSLTDRMPAEQS